MQHWGGAAYQSKSNLDVMRKVSRIHVFLITAQRQHGHHIVSITVNIGKQCWDHLIRKFTRPTLQMFCPKGELLYGWRVEVEENKKRHQRKTPWLCQPPQRQILRGGGMLEINANYVWLQLHHPLLHWRFCIILDLWLFHPSVPLPILCFMQ